MLRRCAAAIVLAGVMASVAGGEPQDPGSGGLGGGLLVQPGQGRQGGPARPAPPAPRSASGKIMLGGSTPAQKGVWLPGPGITGVPIKPVEQVPLQPWARAVFDDRQIQEFEPHTRCKPSGVARAFQTPYGVEFVDLPEMQRIYIFDIGGPHTFRTIYMDGRSHPKDLIPSAYGHSIGWWEGDTLVSDTTGFNERFWLDRKGLPHTEKLRTIERFTRTDFNTIRYEVTVDDPGAYTSTWTTSVILRWEPDTELFEYVCQQANYAHELMVGGFNSIDRTTPTVP